jgi:hypothetical protein
MEQFMLIFHGGTDENTFPSAEAMQAHMGKWIAWVEKLKKNGQYSSGEPLIPGGKLVSGPAGKSVTDGPYTEGKEVVGGYFVIKAKNIDEAIAITKKDYPDFDFGGSVQIRQVMKLDSM